MITIKNIVMKNFMSVGNASQAVNFDRKDLTLVLGENLDLGGGNSKNGVGKTTIINALSYVLYGSALSNIKMNNLINKTNAKNMMVSIEISIDGVDYHIDRGRSPNILRFFKDGIEQNDDNARGEMRDTQSDIVALLGVSHEMFKHTIALNTYTTPFLSLRSNDQKNLIEELLGITLLSTKAEKLKEKLKETKTLKTQEDFRISALINSNEKIEKQIASLQRRQKIWLSKKEESIDSYTNAIKDLMDLNIEEEILLHKNLQKYEKDKKEIQESNKWIKNIIREREKLNQSIHGLEIDIEKINNHQCHACGQQIHNDKQEENKQAKENDLKKSLERIDILNEQEQEHKLKLSEIGVLIDKPKPFYNTLDEAHQHQSTLNLLSSKLESSLNDIDPYEEQIREMKDQAIEEINYDYLNELSNLMDHQTFLLKLLTSKDSFIRRKIIEQNLSYLNNRLTYYLDEINLPHRVKFLSDLSVEITELGRDLDEGNLSRGERTRLILALSWSFRDVFESMFSHVNLLFVDELLDSGLDTDGVENAIHIMKNMARDRGKSVWLVSHREELTARVNNTLLVQKENGFTSFNENE